MLTKHIHEKDFLFRFLQNHPTISDPISTYYETGKTSADKLISLMALHGPVNGRKVLEFASGNGCVTRHLGDSGYAITSCDIHKEAVDFINSFRNDNGNIRSVLSTTDPRDLDLGEKFDVVFALSFFSHIPKRNFRLWLESLFRHVADHGLLIFTTHGKTSYEKFLTYIKLDSQGFGFRGESEQDDIEVTSYGTAVSLAEFATTQLSTLDNARLLMLDEGSWFGHQDTYVVKKLRS